jgi:hypothetical protein
MALPEVSALILCSVSGGTMATKPGPTRFVAPATVTLSSPLMTCQTAFLFVGMRLDHSTDSERVVAERMFTELK